MFSTKVTVRRECHVNMFQWRQREISWDRPFAIQKNEDAETEAEMYERVRSNCNFPLLEVWERFSCR